MSGHLQLIERELRDMIAKESTEQVVKWVKERVLESYRNGLHAQGKETPPASAPTRAPTRGPKPARRYQT